MGELSRFSMHTREVSYFPIKVLITQGQTVKVVEMKYEKSDEVVVVKKYAKAYGAKDQT